MPIYQRPQRQQKEDPLQTALQLYQMFQQPQQGDEMRLMLDMQQQQADREMRQQQFAEEQALRKQTAESEQAYRGGMLEVARGGLEEKGELDEATIQNLITTYTNPEIAAPQKIGAKLMLQSSRKGKPIVDAIDAEQAKLAGDIGGPGGSAGAGAAPPMGPVGLGSAMGGAARQAFGMTPNEQPFDIMQLLKGMFAPQQIAPPQGYQSALSRPNQ